MIVAEARRVGFGDKIPFRGSEWTVAKLIERDNEEPLVTLQLGEDEGTRVTMTPSEISADNMDFFRTSMKKEKTEHLDHMKQLWKDMEEHLPIFDISIHLVSKKVGEREPEIQAVLKMFDLMTRITGAQKSMLVAARVALGNISDDLRYVFKEDDDGASEN